MKPAYFGFQNLAGVPALQKMLSDMKGRPNQWMEKTNAPGSQATYRCQAYDKQAENPRYYYWDSGLLSMVAGQGLEPVEIY